MSHSPESSRPERVVLFTGHRIDAHGREQPRFPAAAEGRARDLLMAAFAGELAETHGPVAGLAGGASGGDVLFHEIAIELGVPTELYLALPPEEYSRESVADGGERWVARFVALCDALPIRLLPADAHREPPGLSLWERSNLWMLDSAFDWTRGGVTLLALWDGRGGDGPGGTADMVTRARARDARVEILDTEWLRPTGPAAGSE